MKNIETVILPMLLLLGGCSSMMPKDAVTQEVINEPKVLFAKKQINMDDIKKYDNRECYPFPNKVTSFRMFERISSTAFIGKIDGYGIKTEYVWVKGPYEKFFPWPKSKGPTGAVLDRFANSNTNCLNAVGCRWDFPENMCVKKHGTALSKENKYWRGSEREVIEIIIKRKLTENERMILLNKQQKELTEEYNKYNEHYQKILQKWKTENSAKVFCNDIKEEWMTRECRFPIVEYECANLANPFVECYKKELIKLSPEYLKALSE